MQPSQRFMPSRHLHRARSILQALESLEVCQTHCAMDAIKQNGIGYTGNSLSLKIVIAFLLGLALYNAIELVVLVFVTFQRYHGLYFWSLVIAAFGIIPYSLGFLIKFFQLLDPNRDVGYVAVFFLTIGWYAMVTGGSIPSYWTFSLIVTGQSVVLWSRLHLLTSSRRVLRWTLWMIIVNGVLLHSTTTVLTFGSNSNSLSRTTLQRFVNGYRSWRKYKWWASSCRRSSCRLSTSEKL